MKYAESILDLVGDTPLVRLTRVTREVAGAAADGGPLILAKLETQNPGGSVKDRIGLPMIDAAERAGRLRPGGTIVEPTSGNTGHGLAIAAALKGYRCIFVMADKQSTEKQALLRAYGAEVVLCPTNVAPESPESYYSVAERLARDIPGAFKPDQYWNQENPRAHEATTGPEIWAQTEGRITHLVASAGTGGTITGAGRYLKAQKPQIRIVGADPEGSGLSGDTARPYLTEGIGEDFVPGTYDASVVNRWVRVSDRDAFAMARRITREEGILAGESCGTAVVATLTVARELVAAGEASGKVIVVIFPDGGRNYLSKLYNDEWMRVNGLLRSSTGSTRVGDVLGNGHRRRELPSVVLARTTDRVGAAIDLLQLHGISQMPVSEAADGGRIEAGGGGAAMDWLQRRGIPQMPWWEGAEGEQMEAVVGGVTERGLLDRTYRDPAVVPRTVGEVMDKPLPTVDAPESLDDAFVLLSGGAPALVVVDRGRAAAVLTKLDLLEFLAHRGQRS